MSDRLDLDSFADIAARAAATDADGLIAPESWKEVVDSGYTRMFHSVEHGGTGAGPAEIADGMEALARACSGTYWAATVSALLCGKLVAAYGPASEHDRLLRPLLSGDHVGCFAIVETLAGSDAATLRTTVRRSPDGGYVIDGEKSRITNAPVADLAVTIARLVPDGPDGLDGPDGDGRRSADQEATEWCLAFVNCHQTGVRRYSIPHMGLRGMPWGGIVFDGAHVAECDVVRVPFGQLEGELAESMAWGWLLISIRSEEH